MNIFWPDDIPIHQVLPFQAQNALEIADVNPIGGSLPACLVALPDLKYLDLLHNETLGAIHNTILGNPEYQDRIVETV